jgi:hypothetical protein
LRLCNDDVTARSIATNKHGQAENNMTRIFTFFRSDLCLSLVGGFALGIAGMAMVKPASATSERSESKAIQIEVPAHADQHVARK